MKNIGTFFQPTTEVVGCIQSFIKTISMPRETPIGYSLIPMVIAHDFSRGLEEMIDSKCKVFTMNLFKKPGKSL